MLAAGGALSLASCDVAAPVPPRAPEAPPAQESPAYERSTESAALRTYYARLQSDLLARGLMRSDDGRRDAPFNARMLVANFIRIAMHDEFDNSSGRLVARETESRLRRWNAPVRMALHFGPSVPEARRGTERARVASLLARLSRVTGHSIRLADGDANFHLHIVDEDERRALGPAIAAAMPGMSASEIAAFTQMPTATYCQVSAMVDNATSEYRRAFAVLRTEHPDLLHLACLHEEIAQGMGLPNDSPQARPSIFNDDQEFALLTPMDELMLRMLYDARLRPGMSIAEARPIIETIAEELLGGSS
ncbi:DUF2927 domain-containing protein [Szabonella alba]|uniref:DUF2927 domain-containing protein n=1 Tax=Szabonella alba TaxID=2804194 RepID=A0A8K0Y1C9_9RHOB|nr:DUF2927 domain-containing protein [Szabonella alba]